jgi:hypothetical protein
MTNDQKGESISAEMRIILNGKGGISLANKELNIFANVPVNTKLYKQLMALFEGRSDRFTWKEGEVTFIPKEED